MPSLRTSLPAGDALRRRMRTSLKAVTGDLEAARSGSGIHAARKRLKATRSFLRILKPALGRGNFDTENHALRDAAHALAPIRRTEAMGEAVRKLAAARRRPEDLSRLAGAIDAAMESEAVAADLEAAIESALAAIQPVRARIAAWTLPKRDTSLYVQGMRESYARARKRLAEGLSTREIALLHEARKSVIHHYHQLDLMKPLWPKVFKAWLAELRDLREKLGDLHDLDELEALIASGRIETDPQLLSEGGDAIAAHRAALIEEIAAETGHLFAERPSSFAARIAALWERQQNAGE